MKKILLALIAMPMLTAGSVPGHFPEVKHGWKNQHEPVSAMTLRQLITGMTRRQVYTLLGPPHFSEGIHSRSWNYALAITTDKKGEALNCGLQLIYRDGRIAEMRWEKPDCANAAK